MSRVDKILEAFGYAREKEMQDETVERLKNVLDDVNKTSYTIKAELNRDLPEWLSQTADAYRWLMPPTEVFANQADLYRLNPILGTAVNILANDIGTSRFNVKRMVGEELRDIPNHEFELLLRNPNPMDSGLEFVQYTEAGYLLNGNSIWWLSRTDKNSTPDEIWPIPFSMIQPVPDRFMYIDHYDYFPGNGKRSIPLETWEIVHFKTYNPNNRFIGLSPIESLAVTVRGDLAMRNTNTVRYTEHGGAPQSILAFKDFVAPKVWEDIKADKREAAKRNEMMMLRGVGDGVSWLQRALTNKDMDFINGLKQNMLDIFNRMCPGLLAMLSESATEANALAARATYSEKTLWPAMEVIAQKVTSDILPAYGRKLVGVFDDPRVVDKKLKLEEQNAYERSHTVEEVRKEYYQDTPLGDERDDLFVSQVKAKAEPAPAQNVQLNKQGDNPLNTNQNTDNPTDVSQQQDNLNVKMLDDLNKWQRKASKRVGRPTAFTSDYLDTQMQEFINDKLPLCVNELAIKAVFEQARQKIGVVTAKEILDSIRMGVEALETN